MSNISEFSNIPDISFIDDLTLEQTINEMITDFQNEYLKITGQKIKIGQVNENRFIINALALQIYQLKQYVNTKGRLNFLKYAYGEFLDNAATFRGITRNPATYAKVTLRFTASDVSESAIGIPGGTQCCNDEGITFQTDEYAEIAPGETTVDITATALEPGTSSNDVYPGLIANIIDPVPYIESVENINKSAGAVDIESDDDFTLRIFKSPSHYSTAGPASAYEYLVKQYRSDIKCLKVTSPSACVVKIVFLLNSGELPDATTIADVSKYINSSDIKPLTDVVSVSAPIDTDYDINLTYYINSSQASQASTIKAAVDKAIEEFKDWQRYIGRDVNPSELIKKIIAAGAKRVQLTSPTFTVIDDDHVPKLKAESITYGGLEDD